MKKFFSLVLALVMALSLTTVAWGVPDTTWPAGTTVNGVTTVELTNDVELSAPVEITTDTVINGNGNTLTVSHARAIIVNGAGVKLTINNLNIVADNNAIRVLEEATNAEISISGSNLTGLSTVNVRAAGAKVTISGGTITCDDQNPAEGYGALTITALGEGAKITATGVNMVVEDDDSMQGLICAKNGVITINGSAANVVTHAAIIVYSNGDAYSFETLEEAVEYADTTSSVKTVTMLKDADDAVAIPSSVTLVKGGYCNGVSAKIGNTKYETLADAVDAAQDGDTIVLTKNNDEDVTVGEEITIDPDGNSYSGTITGTNGLAAVLVNGEYVLQEPANVSVNKSFSNVDTEDWVVVDLTTGTAYDIAEDAEVNKIVYKDIKKTVNGKTTTQYGVTLYGPLTFEGAGAAANGGYAMVVAKESANMQLETAAGKIIFARFITADEYAVYSANEAQYAYTTLVATDYEEKAANPSKCEDVIVSYYVVGDDYYAAATSNADNTLIRYKNEFVIVGQKLDFEPLVPHTFMYDEDACKWSSKDNELVSVKCTCGDTFKIVQDIRGLKAGSYYALGTGDFVILKSTSSGKLPSSSSTTSSSTVTSAETFDAGIAMYVGMSVMAAAGSAVVIGKKKD